MTTRSKEIGIADFLSDVRSGLGSRDLMGKYDLSEHGLDEFFARLLKDRSITSEEFYCWSLLFNNELSCVESVRLLSRESLGGLVSVYDEEEPENEGVAFNICSNGLGVRGIVAAVNEVKTLVIVPDLSTGGEEVVVDARCRWIESATSQDESVGGFEIIGTLEGRMADLIQFVKESQALRPNRRPRA
ncbi:MAG: hypothetical protein HY914_15805 [Desulfomonile tiedjei]|nr:hypothetical protein [Desulfomonile tiedjei]